MAHFTDPRAQGWPVIRPARRHAHPTPGPLDEARLDEPIGYRHQAWSESSYELRRGLEVKEEATPGKLEQLFRRR